MQVRTMLVGGAVILGFFVWRHTGTSKASEAAPRRQVAHRGARIEPRIAPPPPVTNRAAPIPEFLEDIEVIGSYDDEYTETYTAADQAADDEAERIAELEEWLAANGAIRGQVRDQGNGEPLAGVTVVASNDQRTETAITDETGYYQLVTGPGSYTLTMYYLENTLVHPEVTVAAGKVTPGFERITTTTVVKVEDESPTIDGEQGITIDHDYIKNIPVPGRTFESVLGDSAGSQEDSYGVSFSGVTTLENTYVVEEADSGM